MSNFSCAAVFSAAFPDFLLSGFDSRGWCDCGPVVLNSRPVGSAVKLLMTRLLADVVGTSHHVAILSNFSVPRFEVLFVFIFAVLGCYCDALAL